MPPGRPAVAPTTASSGEAAFEALRLAEQPVNDALAAWRAGGDPHDIEKMATFVRLLADHVKYICRIFARPLSSFPALSDDELVARMVVFAREAGLSRVVPPNWPDATPQQILASIEGDEGVAADQATLDALSVRLCVLLMKRHGFEFGHVDVSVAGGMTHDMVVVQAGEPGNGIITMLV